MDYLAESINNSQLKDILETSGEMVLDELIKNEALKEIPILKTVLNISDAVKSIRDGFLIKKISLFLLEIANEDNDQKKKFIDKIESDLDYAGEKILYALDRLDEISKSKLYAWVFIDSINGYITKIERDLLFQAVERINITILNKLIAYITNKIKLDDTSTQHLLNCGLAYVNFSPAIAGMPGSISTNDLAKKFVEIISRHKEI